jgi:hypothetical protein
VRHDLLVQSLDDRARAVDLAEGVEPQGRVRDDQLQDVRRVQGGVVAALGRSRPPPRTCRLAAGG